MSVFISFNDKSDFESISFFDVIDYGYFDYSLIDDSPRSDVDFYVSNDKFGIQYYNLSLISAISIRKEGIPNV